MSNQRRTTRISSKAMNTQNLTTKPAIASIFVQYSTQKWNLKNASLLLKNVLKNAFYLDANSLIAELDRLQFDPQVETLPETEDVLSLWVNDPNLGKVRLECHLKQVKVH